MKVLLLGTDGPDINHVDAVVAYLVLLLPLLLLLLLL